jgi:ubiquinone/menaquinone biosynthesis C-methylase UbiE
VGADIDEKMLANAKSFIESEALGNVELVRDDLFRTGLPAASFDLVHSRFQIAPLGRGAEQMATYRQLLKPGGDRPGTWGTTFTLVQVVAKAG